MRSLNPGNRAARQRQGAAATPPWRAESVQDPHGAIGCTPVLIGATMPA